MIKINSTIFRVKSWIDMVSMPSQECNDLENYNFFKIQFNFEFKT